MLILFDIDDTLLDHCSAERYAAQLLHRRIASTMQLDRFLSDWTAALDRHFARYLAKEISLQDQRRERVREVIDSALSDKDADLLFERYLRDYEVGWTLFADVLPCLDGLAGHRLGIVTNGHFEQQSRKLAKTGILDRFDCIVTAQESGLAKPDPAIFLTACKQAEESPGNSVYIGDRYDVDASAARSAGLKGIWLDRNRAAKPEHSPPIINTLAGVAALI